MTCWLTGVGGCSDDIDPVDWLLEIAVLRLVDSGNPIGRVLICSIDLNVLQPAALCAVVLSFLSQPHNVHMTAFTDISPTKISRLLLLLRKANSHFTLFLLTLTNLLLLLLK